MSSEIHLPDIGADQAEVTEIFVKIGDVIEMETPLIAVEGDKAAMEVPSPQAGTVEDIKISVGDEISTGTLILVLTPAESETPQTEEKDQSTDISQTAPSPEEKEVLLPDIGADSHVFDQVYL